MAYHLHGTQLHLGAHMYLALWRLKRKPVYIYDQLKFLSACAKDRLEALKPSPSGRSVLFLI